jgi:hypothetical protein
MKPKAYPAGGGIVQMISPQQQRALSRWENEGGAGPSYGEHMTTKAGIWIDHRKAVIVTLSPEGDHTTLIDSNVEKHLERGGDSPLKGRYEARQVPADDSRQRALTGELNIYYDAVIAVIRDYGSLLIFGPGEAKVELHKRLLKMKLGARVAAVETEDKMTDRQVMAKLRTHFGLGAPGVQSER